MTERSDAYEVTHRHNKPPLYETDDGFAEPTAENTGREGRDQARQRRAPIFFDIETNAETPQTPIMAVIYDAATDQGAVLVAGHARDDDSEAIRQAVADELPTDDVQYGAWSQRKFAELTIARVAGDDDRVLVAHNAAFDLRITGSANATQFDDDEWQVSFGDWSLSGQRAGQHGMIYNLFHADDGPTWPFNVADTLVLGKTFHFDGSLDGMADRLDMRNIESETHDGRATAEYAAYCANDVAITARGFENYRERLSRTFPNINPSDVYSNASLGKAVMRDMGYDRPTYTPDTLDRVVPAYFGGRTEALRHGRVDDPLRYLDVLSQYPTVCGLTDVWRFAQAERVTIDEIEPSELPTADMTDADAWPKLADYYVEVDGNGAVMPVRTTIHDSTARVKVGRVYHDEPTVYHYFDVIAARLLDGPDPIVKRAWRVNAHGTQDLQSTEVGGTEIPADSNVMAKCIEERKRVQFDVNDGEKDERTKSLKFTANSLYGVTAERRVERVDEYLDTTGQTVERHEDEPHDVAGDFYNPHVAATITAGGRLQLALGEAAVDGDLVYCDTDSLVVPADKTDDALALFDELNPYDGVAGELPALEDEHELDCSMWVADTKKYVLLAAESGVDADSGEHVERGEIIDAKEHGIKVYRNLRGADADASVVELWSWAMNRAGDGDMVNQLPPSNDVLDNPLVWQYSISTEQTRDIFAEKLDDRLRYGDWVESYIDRSERPRTRYFSVDLTSGTVLKVRETDDSAELLGTVDASAIDDDGKKTIRTLALDLYNASQTPASRSAFNVTRHKSITKEATSRDLIFTRKLQFGLKLLDET